MKPVRIDKEEEVCRVHEIDSVYIAAACRYLITIINSFVNEFIQSENVPRPAMGKQMCTLGTDDNDNEEGDEDEDEEDDEDDVLSLSGSLLCISKRCFSDSVIWLTAFALAMATTTPPIPYKYRNIIY